MKILAIQGSLRPNSSSNAVMKEIARMIPPEIEFSVFDTIGILPHFNDPETAPAAVVEFRKQIRDADAVLICTPEYAFGIPGTLKNALDWTVSSGEFIDKPVSLITASSQGEKGHAALLLVLGAISAKIIENACVVISFVRAKLDENGRVKDASTRAVLQSAIDTLVNTLNQKSPTLH
jgi:chromate reductase, NAD(P)H dehydrogenase (quinone)